MTQLKFSRRPSPVLLEHRPVYKIAQVLLVLTYSRSGKSSLLRIHLFNWALKSQQRMQTLRNAGEDGALLIPTWGFDPALAIALRYALAEKLIFQIPNGYQLSDKGSQFIIDALKDEEIFSQERMDLAVVGKKVTEKMVESVAKGWD